MSFNYVLLLFQSLTCHFICLCLLFDLHGADGSFNSAEGNPNPPKLDGSLQPKGNSLKIGWVKQDDGGSAILHYLVRYKP
ncbi:hypothetical protein XENOCAPTIV_028134, partial [Xenoophorus captivus]